jgi:hypothetical protein
MTEIAALEAQIAALKTGATVNTVMSGLIILLSIGKPILLEWIRRRYARRQATTTETTPIETSPDIE